MIPVIAIGRHLFIAPALSLDTIEERTSALHPSIQRFGGRARRQFTGMGEEEIRLTGLMWTDEFGGFDSYLALKQTQRAGLAVPLVSWRGANAFAAVTGPVVILEVGATHEMIGERGIGRKIAFDVKLGERG